MLPALQFDPALIPGLAARYDYASDEHIEQDIVPRTPELCSRPGGRASLMRSRREQISQVARRYLCG